MKKDINKLKRPISRRKLVAIFTTILFAVLSAGITFLALNLNKYSLKSTEFNEIIALDDEVDLTNLIIYNKLTKDEIVAGEYEVIHCDDTTTIGSKTLIIKYKNKNYTVNFYVKYKVEFESNNEIISTQYVDNIDEIVYPTGMEKEGYEFVSWDRNIPTNLTENIKLNAIFSSTTLEIPVLTNISCEYSTKLSEISLPENENGKWIFEDNLNQTVGSVGNHTFNVKFVPKTTELVERYSQVKIQVKKKVLIFNILKNEFTYDGNEHFPEFSLPITDINVKTTGSPEINAREEGYNYTLRIDDPNYYGMYSGKFKINKADVTITVGNKTINWGENFTMPYTIEGFDNHELLNLQILLPSVLDSKDEPYKIDAIINNDNVNATIISGQLIVNKVNLNPEPVNPTLSSQASPATYGDLLGSITFDNTFSNGSWSWIDPSIIIDKIVGFKAIAKFTPKSSNYYEITRELEIKDIKKKTLAFEIINNEFTYDSSAHTIEYKILNSEGLNLVVENNIVQTNAGTYPTTLSILHEFYDGNIDTNLIIHKSTPITDFDFSCKTTWFNGLTLSNIPLPNNYVWINPSERLEVIDAHLYAAQYVPDDYENYNIVNGEISVTVNKQKSYINGIKDNYEFTYNENEYFIQGISASHSESNLIFTYNNGDDDKLLESGEYFVEITLPETKHYYETKVNTTVVIKKANIELSLQTLTATYEDTLSNINLPKDDRGVLEWVDDCNIEVGEVGQHTYKVRFTPKNDNYEIKVLDAVIDVKQKTLIFNILNNEYVYDGIGHSIDYKITDSQGNEYTNLLITGNDPKTNAGSYHITLNVDNKNYSCKKTTDLNIYKAEVNPTIPTGLETIFLDKVKSVVLPSDENGRWIWNVAENVLVGEVGTNKFKATFVVNEIPGCDNYFDYETEIEIKVNPKEVIVPSLSAAESSKKYTSKTIYANIKDTDLYRVTENGWIDVGDYFVELTLKDYKNYIWSNKDEVTTKLSFKITKSKAEITNFNMIDWTYNNTPSEPSAVTNFEGIYFTYLDSNMDKLDAKPKDAGKYFVQAIIDSTNNFDGCCETKSFNIFKDSIKIPTVESVYYTGQYYSTNIPSTDLYTVVNVSNVNLAKEYDIICTIKEGFRNNYKWEIGDEVNSIVKFIINKGTTDITNFSMTGWTYNDQAYEPYAEARLNEVAFDNTLIDFIYYTIDGEKLNSKPENAGKYICTAVIKGTDNYNGWEESIPFTIEKDTIEIPRIDPQYYTGEKLIPDIPTSTLYAIDRVDGTDAGKYISTLTLINTNYKWSNDSEDSVDIEFEILKSYSSIKDFEINDSTYGISESIPSAKIYLQDNILFTKAEVIFKYYVDIDNEKVEITKPINAGNYYVKGFVECTDNYTSSQTEYKAFIIEKRTINTPQNVSAEYIGENQTAKIKGVDGLYTIIENLGGVNCGDYNIKLQLVHPENYKWSTTDDAIVTIKFEITLAQNSWKIEPIFEETVWTYPETIIEPNAEAEFGEVEIKYINQISKEEFSTLPTIPGEYSAIYYVQGNTHYSSLNKTIYFSILKKELTVPDNITIEYYASAYTTNIQDTNEYTVSNITRTEAGNYNVVCTIKEDKRLYYKWPNTESATYNVQFIINKSDEKITDFIMGDWIYGETESNPTANFLFGNEKISFTYSKTKDGQYTSTKFTDVGTYFVKAKVLESKNYIGDEQILDYTINLGQAQIYELVIEDWTYNMTASDPSEKHNLGSVEYTYYTIDGENKLTKLDSKPTNAGNYRLVATIATTDNFLGTEAYDDFSISKAKAEVKDFSISKQNWTFEEDFAEITYAIYLNDNKYEKDDIKVLISYFKYDQAEQNYVQIDSMSEDAGQYKITAQIVNTNNYTDIGSKILYYTIGKKGITIPTIDDVVYYDGNTHSTNLESTEIYSVQNVVDEKDAGTYFVECTINEEYRNNYKWETGDEVKANIEFIINKGTTDIKDLSLTKWKYNENPNNPTAKVLLNNVENQKVQIDIKYTYSTTINGQYEDTLPSTDAGTYYVKATIAPTENYEGKEYKTTFIIEPGDAKVESVNINDWTYGENPSNVSSKTTLNGKEGYVFNISYKYYKFDTKSQSFVEFNSHFTSTTDAGRYKVEAIIPTSSNYTCQNNSKEFIIKKANTSIELKIKEEWTYYKNEQAEATADVYLESVYYDDLVADIRYYKLNENGEYVEIEYDISTNEPNAGDYKVIASIEGTHNYNGSTAEKTFTINKLPVDVPIILPNSYPTYNGAAISTMIEKKAYYTNDFSNLTKTDAGTYTLTITLINDNFEWKDVSEEHNDLAEIDELTVKIKYQIKKADPTITSSILDKWDYDGTVHEVTATASICNGSIAITPIIEYYEVVGEIETILDSAPKNAGNYRVKVIVEETNNYLGKVNTHDYTINELNPTIDIPEHDLTYIYATTDINELFNSKISVTSPLTNETISGEWESSDLTHTKDNSKYTLKFISKDRNYKSVDNFTANLKIKSVAVIGSTYYPTIESALDTANSGDTVYVLADNTGNVKITDNTTIKSNVVLVLPFDSNNTRDTNADTFAIATKVNDTNNPTLGSRVIIENGIKLINNGVLEVAGELSGKSSTNAYAGHTAGLYAEILLNSNAKIESTGSIILKGFINENTTNHEDGNGSEIVVQSGDIGLPFVVRDFRGGSYMLAARGGALKAMFNPTEVALFNQYEFRNISSKLILKNSATLTAYCNLYANSQQNFKTVKMVGKSSDYLIEFNSNNSYIEAKYNPDTEICDLDIYGGAKLNSMSLSIDGLPIIGSLTVQTSSLYFPINWRWNISLNGTTDNDGNIVAASYELKQKLKMMPGAVLRIEKGATVEFSKINVYSTYTDQTSVGGTVDSTKYANKIVNGEPVSLSLNPAKLIVNGTMIVSEFGGEIYSESSGAKVTINSKKTMTTQETIGDGSSREDITNNAVLKGSAADITNANITLKKTYTYDGSKWT